MPLARRHPRIMSHHEKLSVLQVKGDFDALLNADNSKSATTKHLPVLLDLRKSGSFKPQSSLDSAASFATAPSSSSDKVSEAAGPTNSSRASGTISARDSSPLRPGPLSTDASAEDELLLKHSNNGIAEDAEASAAGARQGPPEALSAVNGQTHDSRGLINMQGIEQRSSSGNAALHGGPSKVQSAGDPLGPREAQPDSSPLQHAEHPPDLGQDTLTAGSRSLAETSETSEQMSSTQAAQTQEDMEAVGAGKDQDGAAALLGSLLLSKGAQRSRSTGSASAKDSHPLESHTPDALAMSRSPSGGPRQDSEKDSATLHSPLQNSTHEALSGTAVRVDTPSSGTAASQNQTARSDSQELAPQDSRSNASLQNTSEEAGITSEEAGDEQSTRLHEQAASTARQEHSVGAQQRGKSDSGPRRSEEATALAKPAEPGERFQGAQGQLGTALGPEASEELPVSTLGARCLSEVLAGSLPEPESSAAGDSSAADAGAAGHDEGMDEPDEEDAHGQQGIASLPHGYQLVPAMPYY